MANYYSLRDGLITDTSTYGMSISGAEKTTNTTAYTLTTSDSWSTVLSSSTTDVIDSIAVHLSSRAANPVGMLSAETAQYAGILTKTGTTLSAVSPFPAIEANSVYFNGTTSSYVRASTPVSLPGDFTIETWAYFNALATGTNSRMLIESWSGTTGWQLYYRGASSALGFYINNGLVMIDPSTTRIATNTWYHIAVTRSSNTLRMFVNGTQCVSATNSANIIPTNPLNIGTQSSTNTHPYNGYMSNIRIVNGTALYTSNFTPTDSPLPIVSNTSFLYQAPYINAYKSSTAYLNTLVGTYPISSFTSFDGSNNTVATYPLNWQLLKLSAPFTNSSGFFSLNLKTSDADQLSLMGASTVNGVDYDRMAVLSSSAVPQPTITARGFAALEPTIKPYSYFDNSMYFDGVSAYLEVPPSPYFNLDKDFTIEFWLNTNFADVSALDGGTDSRNVFTFARTHGSNNLTLLFWTGVPSANVSIWANGLIVTGTIPVANSNWHHVAISRSNGLLRLFVDGVQSGNTANSTTAFNAGITNSLFIFSRNIATGRVKGYLNEFRIINGIGLYTQNFTPPTQTLNSTFRTVLLLKTGTTDAQKIIQQDAYPLDSTDSVHIGSVLSGYSTESRSTTAGNITLPNLYVHNKADLVFSPLSGTALTINGSEGLQITSEGTVEVGTSSTPVPKDITHQIILSNNHIGVSNGGRLDVYGSYKVPYTKLTTPSLSTARTFTVVDAVSSNWQVNDTVVFTPNTALATSYDTLVLSSFDSDNTFRTTTSAAFAHTVLDYVPNVANLTRNVKIGGASSTAKGYVAARGGATVNINNTEFKFIDTGLTTGVDSNGLFTVSGCTLSGNGTETLLSPIATEFATVFNGTNSYVLGTANNTDFDVDVGTDFTLECFIKQTVASGTYRGIFGVRQYNVSSNADWAFILYVQSDNSIKFGFCVGATGKGIATPANVIKLNKWHHLCVTGRNGRFYLYVDGILRNSATQESWNFRSTFIPIIGKYPDLGFLTVVSNMFNGNISNLRFVKGRAMYTSNFTPPNSPLVEISDTGVYTAILTFQASPVVDNSYHNDTLTLTNITAELDSPFGKDTINASINDNVVFKPSYGLSLDNIDSNNTSITKNLLLSSKDAGIYVNDGLKGDLTFNGNVTVGPSPYGSLIQNNTTGKTLSSIVNYNNTTGMFINNAHAGRIDNVINTHNTTGVYVDGTISELNETTFTNITASNNRTLGFRVSGNAIDHLSPITLNINNLVANNNLSGGFEGYCITGNLTSLELNRNGIYGMKTSIGNYYTTIDGITAIMNNVASTSAGIGILSGLNYYPTVIKNANIDGSNKSGISLDSTNFSQFYVYNSTVSGATSDFNITASRNVLEGSYIISNTNVGPLPIGIGITSNNYQSDVLKTTGFAFTNMNNASGFNTTYLAAGTRAVDSTIKGNISATTSPSERLTPQSTSLKLRSGSKFVALDANQSTRVSVYVRKSSTTFGDSATYNGSSPRLILKRNGAMGINSDMVMDQLDTIGDEFLKLSGTTQTVTDAGVLEFYVDCDGTTGWINIDNWTAN